MLRTQALGGEHTLLFGASYDWTSFYSAMGLFVTNTPSGTIDLANPAYAVIYTPQVPVNSFTDDRFETFALYLQDQATYGPLHLTGGVGLTSLKFVEDSNIWVDNNSTYTRLSPRFGATLDVVPGVALYAGYATVSGRRSVSSASTARVPRPRTISKAGLSWRFPKRAYPVRSPPSARFGKT
jgi:iron complex outermembrane receptor protein